MTKEVKYYNPKTDLILGSDVDTRVQSNPTVLGGEASKKFLFDTHVGDAYDDDDDEDEGDDLKFEMTMAEATEQERRSINKQMQKEDSKRLSLTEKIIQRRKLERLLPNIFQRHQSWRDRRNVTSKKLPARFFLMIFTVLHFLEMSLNSVEILTWYSGSTTNSRIFSPLSFQSLFTHFIINTEWVHTKESTERNPPEPTISWHPFNKPFSKATVCLRIHFWLHFLAYVFPLMKVLLDAGESDYLSLLSPIFNISLSPILYYFLTAITVSINLEHTKIELESLVQNSFITGVGALFIDLYLSFESLGCIAHTSLGIDECASTINGNWMLGFNACFLQLTSILLAWVVEAHIETQKMMRFELSARFAFAFALQIIASMIFLFFFAIKENSPEGFVEEVWGVGSTMFLCLWGASFASICWRNLPCHDNYGHSITPGFSFLFNESKSRKDVVHNHDNEKEKDQTQLESLSVSLDSAIEAAKDEDGGEEDGRTNVNNPATIAEHHPDKASESSSSMSQDSHQTPDTNPDLNPNLKPGSSRKSPLLTLSQSIRDQVDWTALQNIITDENLYILRFFFMCPTYLFLAHNVWMATNLEQIPKVIDQDTQDIRPTMGAYLKEVLGPLSFGATGIHFSILVGHDFLYAKTRRFPCVNLCPRAIFDTRIRWDRILRIFFDPRLQYWMHASSAFLWKTGAKIYHGQAYIDYLGEDESGWDKKGLFFMLLMYPVYVRIIRRMCGALREKMNEDIVKETSKSIFGEEGDSVTSELFSTGVSLMAIITFLCFELGGCIYSKELDWNGCVEQLPTTCNGTSVNLNDNVNVDITCVCDWPSKLGECDSFYVGNVSMAIQIVWVYIFRNMLLGRLSIVDIFTANIRHYEMFSFGLLIPTFVSTGFLFARREQTPTDINSRGPLEHFARMYFNNYQVATWLLAAMILGHYHLKVKDTNWFKSLPDERRRLINPDIGKRLALDERLLTMSTRLKKVGRWKRIKYALGCGRGKKENLGEGMKMKEDHQERKEGKVDEGEVEIELCGGVVGVGVDDISVENIGMDVDDIHAQPAPQSPLKSFFNKLITFGSSHHINDGNTDTPTQRENRVFSGKDRWKRAGHEVVTQQKTALRIFNFSVVTGRHAQHKRLYILKTIMTSGTVIFLLFQTAGIYNLMINSDDSLMAYGYAAQPLSLACWITNFFSKFVKPGKRKQEYYHFILHMVGQSALPMVYHANRILYYGGYLEQVADDNSEETYWSFALYLGLDIVHLAEWILLIKAFTKVRQIMRFQHFNRWNNELKRMVEHKGGVMRATQKTLEAFFGQALSAFLVISYVFFEAEGCIESTSDLIEDYPNICRTYFTSTRMFGAVMASPLILYIISLVSDLDTYDLMTGRVESRLIYVSFVTTCLTCVIAVYAFGIREFSLADEADKGVFNILSTNTFLLVWESLMYFSYYLMMKGVIEYWGDGLGEDGSPQIKAEMAHRQKSADQRRDSFSRELLHKTKEGGVGGKTAAADEYDDHVRSRKTTSISDLGSRGAAASYFKEDMVDVIDLNSLHYRKSRGIKMGSQWSGLVM